MSLDRCRATRLHLRFCGLRQNRSTFLRTTPTALLGAQVGARRARGHRFRSAAQPTRLGKPNLDAPRSSAPNPDRETADPCQAILHPWRRRSAFAPARWKPGSSPFLASLSDPERPLPRRTSRTVLADGGLATSIFKKSIAVGLVPPASNYPQNPSKTRPFSPLTFTGFSLLVYNGSISV
jgi:hypothetical protein